MAPRATTHQPPTPSHVTPHTFTAKPVNSVNLCRTATIMSDIGILGATLIWLGWTALRLMVLTATLFIPMSIVWAPIAGLITAKQARRRGLTNTRYYGMVGALYAALLLLPWIHLTLRLSGRTVPLRLIRAVYITVYILWAFYLLVTYVLGLSLEGNPTMWPILFVGVIAYFVSAWMLFRLAFGNDRREEVQHAENDYRLTQRNLVYLTPFAFLIFQSLVFVVPPFL